MFKRLTTGIFNPVENMTPTLFILQQIHQETPRLSSQPQFHLLRYIMNDPIRRWLASIDSHIIAYTAIFINNGIFNKAIITDTQV